MNIILIVADVVIITLLALLVKGVKNVGKEVKSLNKVAAANLQTISNKLKENKTSFETFITEVCKNLGLTINTGFSNTKDSLKGLKDELLNHTDTLAMFRGVIDEQKREVEKRKESIERIKKDAESRYVYIMNERRKGRSFEKIAKDLGWDGKVIYKFMDDCRKMGIESEVGGFSKEGAEREGADVIFDQNKPADKDVEAAFGENIVENGEKLGDNEQ